MSRCARVSWSGCVLFLLGIGVGSLFSLGSPDPSISAGAAEAEVAATGVAVHPVAYQAGGPAPKRPDAWYPRTEQLAPDEMFVVALGTGMPTPITRARLATISRYGIVTPKHGSSRSGIRGIAVGVTGTRTGATWGKWIRLVASDISRT